MNKHLPEFIEKTRKRGHLAVMSTNAISFRDTKYLARLVASGINRISVSLYEHSLDELREILLSANPVKRLNTTMVLTKTMVEERPESVLKTIEVACKTGCADIFINCCTDVAGGGESPELIFDDNAAYRQLKDEAQKAYPRFPIIWGLPVPRKIEADRHWCALIWNGLTMDMLGNMGQCCAVYPDPCQPFGNYFQDSTDSILNHPLSVAMRRGLLNKNDEVHKRCATCSYIGNAWLSKR